MGPGTKKLKTAPQPSMSTAPMEWDDSPEDQAERHLIELARGPIEEEVDEGEEEGEAANEILDDLRLAFDSAEQWGPPVADGIAKVLKNHFDKKLDDDQVKVKLAKYNIPENCSVLGVPRMNREVVHALKPQVRKGVVRLSNTQHTIFKAAVAITQCIDQLIKLSQCPIHATKDARPMIAECVGKLLDTLALAGHANHDLSLKRQDMHKFSSLGKVLEYVQTMCLCV